MPGAERRHIRSIGRNPLAGISLAKRRRWYADEDKDADTDDDQKPGADGDDGGSEDDADNNEQDVPELLKQLQDGMTPEAIYALVSGLRDEAATGRQAKKDLLAAQTAQADKEREDAESQGEFKKLWEDSANDRAELVILREEKAARLEQVSERNAARLKELPKDKRAIAEGIIEKAGMENPDTVSAILDDLLPTLATTPKPPPGDGGSKGDGRKGTASSKVELNRVSY